jgi:hypothetical protein
MNEAAGDDPSASFVWSAPSDQSPLPLFPIYLRVLCVLWLTVPPNSALPRAQGNFPRSVLDYLTDAKRVARTHCVAGSDVKTVTSRAQRSQQCVKHAGGGGCRSDRAHSP